MRTYSLSFLIVSAGLTFVFAMYLPASPGADTQEKSDAAVDAFKEVARFSYGQSTISGMGSSIWTSGATLSTLPADKDGVSQFVFSLAFDRSGLDVGSIRLIARDKDGKELPNQRQSAASGAGTKSRVVTFVCAFRHSHDQIKELVIEERIQR